jgi:hypothetical protein
VHDPVNLPRHGRKIFEIVQMSHGVLDFSRAQALALGKKNQEPVIPYERELRLAIQQSESQKVSAILLKIQELLPSDQAKDTVIWQNLLGVCLHLAALYGDCQTIAVLIDNKANLNALSPNRSTPLHRAVSNNNLEAVQLMVTSGADHNASTLTGLTPLGISQQMNLPEISHYLQSLA